MNAVLTAVALFILGNLITPLALQLLTERAPTLASGLLVLARRFLPTAERDRYLEEWSAELEAMDEDERLSKLFAALRILVSAPSLGWVLRGRPQRPSLHDRRAATLSTAGDRVEQARRVLRDLNFDNTRSNERSALVLLALLGLEPETPWTEATTPLLGITEIMDRVRDHYQKVWLPNTRETVRRQTVHQFLEAALIVKNPDKPERATNSVLNRYQIEPRALELLRSVEADDFPDRLHAYLVEAPDPKALVAMPVDVAPSPVMRSAQNRSGDGVVGSCRRDEAALD